MNMIAYDFEVFIHDWLVVIIDLETKQKTEIINDSNKLETFYNNHKTDIWIGYNSRNYDQYILKGILCGMNPFTVNNEIILNDRKGAQVVKKGNDFILNNFDISTGFHSLKQLEGFMGSKIKESSIPFTINRKLTNEEIQEVIEYCIHDVEQTIEVFNHRKEEYDSQLALITAFDLSMDYFTKTKAQLAAVILGTNKTDRNDEFNLSFPDTLVISEKYKYIVDWYKNPDNMNYKKSLITDVAGVSHVFAWGGIHGALPNYSDEGLILCLDVASLYPSLMIEYGYISRNVINPHKYKEIRDTRLKLKAEKNPMQLPYKIVLNSTYGAMKDEYNYLYDPLMANNVCIAGQLLLLDLIEKIEPYCKLIQSNTDGLFLKVNTLEDIDIIKNIAKEWEQRTRLDLEWDLCSKLYQKDVNNYIIIDSKGKYKSKGAYVKKLTEIDYDLPILNEALISYFLHNKEIETTINECNDLRKFQKIIKVTRLYSYALHGEKILDEKVIRVFASTDKHSPGIFKVKKILDENEIVRDKIEKVGNTPDNCFIYNDNVKNISVPANLDRQYYIECANKRLKEFLHSSKIKKHKIPSDIKFVNNEIRDEVINCLNEHIDININVIDLLSKITNTCKVDSRQLKILIMLNYFAQYGKNKYLLNIIDLFFTLSNIKQIRFSDIEKLNINEGLLKKYSNKITKSLYKELDMIGYLKEIILKIPNKSLAIKEQVKFEMEYLGYTNYTNDQASTIFYIIIEYKIYSDKYKPYVTLHNIKTGETMNTKIVDSQIFIENPFKLYDVLKIKEFGKQKKSVNINGKWKKTNETEPILTQYEVY